MLWKKVSKLGFLCFSNLPIRLGSLAFRWYYIVLPLLCDPKCGIFTHYSKIQIFVQKFNFDKTLTFSRVFHSKFFWQFFSWNQSCQQLKNLKPQHFHEFFTGKSKLNFWRKNEDFEQCVALLYLIWICTKMISYNWIQIYENK